MPIRPMPFTPWLSVATQALQGVQQGQQARRQQDLEERDYADQQEQRRLAQQDREAQRTAQADAEAYRRAQIERENTRQDNLDLRGAYNDGMIPEDIAKPQAAQVQAVGQQMAPTDTSGVGLGLQVAGQQVQAQQSPYSIAGRALVKGRASLADVAREDAQEARRLEREAANATELQRAAMTIQGKREADEREANLRRELNQNTINNRPQPRLQTIPSAAIDGMAQTRATLGTIDDALGTIKSGKADGHIGPSRRFLPNWVSQVTDPEGAPIRGQLAGIGAVIRHELSGAAITPSEAKFLEPDIPGPDDRPEIAQDKLMRLRKKLSQIDADKRLQYSEENGYRNALPAGQSQAAAAPAPAAQSRPPLGAFKR